MLRTRLAHTITLAFLVLLALAPAAPAAAHRGQIPSYESPTSPMEVPWGG